METTTHDPTSKLDEPELDLYTIPSHSSWFLWDEIHATEKLALREFFDGSSFSRTPKIYKEYRDFIINKYREEPSRRLSFTDVRKSLVGDVSLLHKVFRFLDERGLINFSAPSGNNTSLVVVEDGEDRSRIKIEGVVPNAVRVGASPNSPKPISVPPNVVDNAVEKGFKFLPLASYSDVFGDLVKPKGLICGNCGGICDSGHYKYTKGEFIICINCFKNQNYGENRSMDEFKLNECAENKGSDGAIWTEAETLLLLESVLKHGDDWELVAQNVQTKSKVDCILKLIELPFGELVLGSAHKYGNYGGLNGSMNGTKQAQLSSSEHHEAIRLEGQCHEQINEREENGDTVDQGHPSKRQRIASLSDAGSSLMKQVARISTMVGSQTTAAAAEAAVTALCDENSFPREIFDVEEDHISNGLSSPTASYEAERVLKNEESKTKEGLTQSETVYTPHKRDDIPLTLQIRASIATALGAAAARAKLLAEQEDREVENLVGIIIETQMKKLHQKIKHFEDLELIMEKEYTEMEELKDCLLAERIGVLQKAINAGISRWRDHSVKS
ncbi:SWI/SNF complex subunit SWI3A [Juglans microcarpa x Juglans regia]|uniref:SWI/SNF complex subunit SWI3A n=1 Tax=Juglans microcarpa x Juglans regia TaxID=2249226 RepID=UPI001B7F3A77|nr:SWI/SNF complex subunit SWI3A [Juglans microcarpa x Juglans regia]